MSGYNKFSRNHEKVTILGIEIVKAPPPSKMAGDKENWADEANFQTVRNRKRKDRKLDETSDGGSESCGDPTVTVVSRQYRMKIENRELKKQLEDQKQLVAQLQKEIRDIREVLNMRDSVAVGHVSVADVAGKKEVPHGQNEIEVPEMDEVEMADAAISAPKAAVGNDEFPTISKAASMKPKPKKKATKSAAVAVSNVKVAASSIRKSIPTITTYGIDVKLILGYIGKVLGHDSYSARVMHKNVTNIQVSSVEDHSKVQQLLRDHKVQFYTFTPKVGKPVAVTMRGLPVTYDETDVKTFIEGLKMSLTILSIKKLGGTSWLLSFSRDSDLASFFKVKYVLRCAVTFERFRRNSPTQCYKCQRYGHVSSNCNMPFRCVKCGGDHGPGKCAIPAKGDDTAEVMFPHPVSGEMMKQTGHIVSCVNCKVQGHTAGSRTCPKRVSILRRMQENRAAAAAAAAAPRANLGRTHNIVRPNVSYANAARANFAPQMNFTPVAIPQATGGTTHSARAGFDLMDRDCREFFGKDVMSCIRDLNTFARQYTGVGDKNARSNALLGMIHSMSLNV